MIGVRVEIVMICVLHAMMAFYIYFGYFGEARCQLLMLISSIVHLEKRYFLDTHC